MLLSRIFVLTLVYVCSQMSSFSWVSIFNRLHIAQVMLSLLAEVQWKPQNVTTIRSWSWVH